MKDLSNLLFEQQSLFEQATTTTTMTRTPTCCRLLVAAFQCILQSNLSGLNFFEWSNETLGYLWS